MKFFVCRLALAAVLAATAIAPADRAQAQGNAKIKPALVISIASVDEQLADAEFLFDAAGLPKILLDIPKAQLEGGIDSAKPLGGYATVSEADGPKLVAFVPVSDFDMALDKFEEGIAERKEVGKGVLRLTLTNDNDVYVKQSGDWAFASDSKENLSDLPENPVALLGGLDKKYNVAVQINGGNIPAKTKEMAVEYLEQALKSAGAQLADQEPDLGGLTEGIYGELLVEQIKMIVTDTDRVTVGFASDSDEDSTYIDFTIKANDGSEFAKQLERNAGAKSEFLGFLVPGSALNLNFISKLAESDIDPTVKMLEENRKTVISKLETDGSLTGKELDVTRELIGSFFDAFSETVKTGKVDGGATLMLSEDAATFVAGGHIANAKSLEKPLQDYIKIAADEPNFPKFKLNAAKHGDVSFHMARIPIPAQNLPGQQIFGDSFEVVLGIGNNSAYFALGNQCVKTISKVIDKSSDSKMGDQPQGQFTISMKPIVTFAASVNDDPRAKSLATKFEDAENDKIRITSRAIENGATSRIEVESDVFKLVGEVAQLALSGGF